ncbi:hypothetical protein Y032_0492g2421 [Ancylostoma ceylanicum]|uniref:Uncharacterized protein n=1 Tax=Ancylostoma ceylanicum TaxID=53326 RepID=A0A016WV62_9BILA|nr:hypothetical protein Y032_0492g2421 [Ancylostoma ceylanicum]
MLNDSLRKKESTDRIQVLRLYVEALLCLSFYTVTRMLGFSILFRQSRKFSPRSEELKHRGYDNRAQSQYITQQANTTTQIDH